MRIFKCAATAFGCGALLVATTGCPRTDHASDASRHSTKQVHEADNTGRNADDPGATPMDQGSSEADRSLTQRVRQALMAEDALSTNAKNVKIITREGKVTLRGPVADAAERMRIGAIAEGIVGTGNVTNQLELETPKG